MSTGKSATPPCPNGAPHCNAAACWAYAVAHCNALGCVPMDAFNSCAYNANAYYNCLINCGGNEDCKDNC